MARETQSTIIDGLSITVQQLPGGKAARYFLRLTKLIGPSVLPLLASKNPKELMEVNIKELDFTQLAESLFDRIDENESFDFILKLLEFTFCNERPVGETFDALFRGRIWTMFKVLGFTLKVNYGETFLGDSSE